MAIVAEHVNRVKASEVSVVSAKALELERQGRDIIRLSAGEPDFATPDHIKLACIKALCDNKTKYPPVIGLFELREAICAKLQRDNALEYSPSETIVSSGCKQVIYNAMTATLNPGDEVVLLAPYWMSYAGHCTAEPGNSSLHADSPRRRASNPQQLLLRKRLRPRQNGFF